jgi:hypothetical protein
MLLRNSCKLKQKGSFSVITNPKTGLIQTSDTENQTMVRQWFTDSCMVGTLQRETDPKNWQQSMITNAAALNQKNAREAVQQTLKNPDWYRKGDIMNGVFHIYLPKTVKVDSAGLPIAQEIQHDKEWFNQKRLESQALMLLNLVDTIRSGLADKEKKPWGFTPHQLFETKAGEYITHAIGDLSQYLMAVNTNPASKQFDFHTPSASSWEEAPFKEGMTSDAALTVLAMEHLQQLLYTDHSNPAIDKIRKQIKDKMPAMSSQEMTSFIEKGREFVQKRITEPLKHGSDPIQTPNRPYDTSLCLLAASDYRFSPENLLEDAKIRVKLVTKTKEALLRENGMLRYPEFTLQGASLHDSYLNRGYHFPEEIRSKIFNASTASAKQYGSTDASSLEALQDRQALSTPEHAAQWGLGLSASLQALAKAKHDVLTVLQRNGKPSDKITALLQTIDKESLDFLNRNLAAIPGPLKPGQTIIRADGTPLKPYLPIEAYEFVPDNQGKMVAIPGAHTLPWHAAQLYDGLQKLKISAQIEESLLKTDKSSILS